MNQQEFEANSLQELINELAEKNHKLLQDYYAEAQQVDIQKDEIAKLKEDLAAMTAYAEMFERGEIGVPGATGSNVVTEKLTQLYAKLEMYEKEPKKSYVEQIMELQQEVKALRSRLHWIWAIGVDYDGCGTVESLKELIDEMVDFTQMSDEQVDYSIYRKGAIETADKIIHYLYRMSQTDTSKEVAIGRCIDWIKNNFGA
jgi:DNA repair exonuclease SbcCD ATPase subunit